eukprot:TRINITY_DN9169_c0_g1_i4.p1 TRINITY_DN9169_c0_g1~~TRINITY_DN9169_c0_g1_i4.p1  ORF type:complete len:323 (-),score=59.79 TRINITY_DN9169_c0_g1_i4:225-1073(-)
MLIYEILEEESCTTTMSGDYIPDKFEYIPKAIPASDESVNEQVLEYGMDIFEMASYLHDRWSLQKINSGWRYTSLELNMSLRSTKDLKQTIKYIFYRFAETKKESEKMHDCIKPFEELNDDTKMYDRRIGKKTLQLLLSVGCTITRKKDKNPTSPQNETILHDAYTIKDFPSGEFALPQFFQALAPIFGENAHEAYCEGFMKDGYTYGEERNEKTKTHNLMKPYFFLTPDEKQMCNDAFMAVGTFMTARGYELDLNYVEHLFGQEHQHASIASTSNESNPQS